MLDFACFGDKIILVKTRTVHLRTAPVGALFKDNYKRVCKYSDCWTKETHLVMLNYVPKPAVVH